MDRDSGVFHYAGKCMLAGQKPYVDFWDHKPPVIYLLNAGGLALGFDRWGVWLIETLLFALSSATLFAALRKPLALPAALAGMAAAMLTLRCGTYFLGGNLTESYVSSFQMFLLAGLVGNSSRLWSWIGMGVCAGLIAFTKQSCVVLPVAGGMALLTAALVRRCRRNWSVLGSYLLGGCATAAAIAAWMFWAGILKEFWDCNFVFNRVYVEAGGFPDAPGKRQGALAILWGMGMFAPAGAAMLGCLLCVIRGSQRNFPRLAAGVVLASIPLELAAISLPGTFYGHYFLSLFPMVGVGIALLVEAALGRHSFRSGLAGWRWVLASAIVTLPLVKPLGLLPEKFKTLRTPSADIDAAMRDYLCVDAGRPLLVWGAETRWNFLSRRLAPSRYVYNYPLCYPKYDQAKRFAEFLDALRRHPDTLIVDADALTHNSLRGRLPNPAPTVAPEIPPELMAKLREHLAEKYQPDRVFANGWVAYRPK